MTKEQEVCGQIEQALSALYEVRHTVIHLGNAIGLGKDQREGLAFLLVLASEVTSDTLESIKLDNARSALAPLLQEPASPAQLALGELT